MPSVLFGKRSAPQRGGCQSPEHATCSAQEICKSVLLWALTEAFVTPWSAPHQHLGRRAIKLPTGPRSQLNPLRQAGLSSRRSLQPARLQTLTRNEAAAAHGRVNTRPPHREMKAGCCLGGRGEKAEAEVEKGRVPAAAALQTCLGNILHCRNAAEDRLSCSGTSGPRRLFSPKGAFPLPPPPPLLAEPVSHGRSQIFPPQKGREGRGRQHPAALWVTDGWVLNTPRHGAHSIRGRYERKSR